jgi:hypothetical protein
MQNQVNPHNTKPQLNQASKRECLVDQQWVTDAFVLMRVDCARVFPRIS